MRCTGFAQVHVNVYQSGECDCLARGEDVAEGEGWGSSQLVQRLKLWSGYDTDNISKFYAIVAVPFFFLLDKLILNPSNKMSSQR